MIDLTDRKINEICNSSELKTFGIILYNEENPNIIKLLRDDDYWNALDKASGEKFIIFAIKPKKGFTKIPQMQEGIMGMLVPVWEEPSDNKEILDNFDLKSTKELPKFFIFTKVGDVLLKKSITIDETNVDISLDQLKKIFQNIRDIIEKSDIREEHKVQIHDKIEHELEKHNFRKALLKADSFLGKIKKYISPF